MEMEFFQSIRILGLNVANYFEDIGGINTQIH